MQSPILGTNSDYSRCLFLISNIDSTLCWSLVARSKKNVREPDMFIVVSNYKFKVGNEKVLP